MNIANFELLIKPIKPLTREEIKEAKENREHLLFLLMQKELEKQPHLQLENKFYLAFKNKEKVTLKSTGEKVYIHEIQTNIEWESNRVVVKYIIRRDGDFKEQHAKGLSICQPEEIEI